MFQHFVWNRELGRAFEHFKPSCALLEMEARGVGTVLVSHPGSHSDPRPRKPNREVASGQVVLTRYS